MGLIDIVLLFIVGAFVMFGFFFGLVHTLGSLIGSIVGMFLSTRLVDPAFEHFGFIFGGGHFGRIIMFIIVFFLISRLVGIVFWFIGKMWDVISFIPFAKTFDRLLGGAFGFIEGVVVLGVILFYAQQVLPQDTLLAALHTSAIAKYLLAGFSAIQILLPESFKSAQKAVQSTVPS